MLNFFWNYDKNQKLLLERNVDFDNVIDAIAEGNLLDILKSDKPKYQHQHILVVLIKDYVYYIPFVEHKNAVFFKTIIPSRKLNKKYKLRKKPL